MRRWLAVLLALVVVVAAAGVALALVARSELGPVQSSQTRQVLVTVKKGESLNQVVATLGSENLIRSQFFFKLYADTKGLGAKLRAGHFFLDRGMGASEVVNVLSGPPQTVGIRVTIPDGLRAQQEAAVLQKQGLFSQSAYLAQVKSAHFSNIAALPGAPAGASWEGMAFGDTYQVSPSVTPRQFLQVQLQDFNRRLRQRITAGAGKVGLNPYQVLTLASIVSAEASNPKDQHLIAGVFYNRLRIGMPLQSDVTVLYAQAVAGQANAPFNSKFNSPYNTYLHPGLPPGPIDSPGVSAVLAALQPTSSNYLYFVALPNGKVLYAVTAAQHQQQVQQAGLG